MTPARPDPSAIRWLVAGGLALLTLILFWPATQHDFVNYDDPDYVTENAQVQGGLTAEGVRWALGASVASNWHPLTWMSHMLDWSLHGNNPRGHHLTSVLLHAVNAALAFLALWRLTRALWPSAACAALFAWHPLRVESVAWVAERKDVLSGLCWFLVLWLYARYAERRREGLSAGRWYGLALAAFALGLMAKPMLVTLPCVLLLFDVWPLRRLRVSEARPASATPGDRAHVVREPWWFCLGEKLPFFLLVVVSAIVTYRVQDKGGAVSAALTMDARLANAAVAVVAYVRKLFWPSDLAVLYPHPGHWPTGTVIMAAGTILAVSIIALWQRRARPWIAVGWLWFLGTLVPVIGIVQVGLQSMADRYTYLPMVGLQIALLWTLNDMIAPGRARRVATFAFAAVLVACALRTWNQLGVWRDSFTLFDQALRVTKNNYVAHDNRGLFLFKAGRVEEAMADYRRALSINPAYLNANNNLGHTLTQLGRPAEALPFYRTAFTVNPAHLEVRNNLANALSDVGQLDEAMQHYDFVLARQPNHANALNGSGVVLAMRGQAAEARQRIERSLQLKGNNAAAHNNLGNICSMLKQYDDAVRHYRRAAELNPAEPHPLVLAGITLNQQGRYAEAVQDLQRAITVRPVNPEAQAHLGLALAQIGRREEARRALRTALQQKPDFTQAAQWLQALDQAK